MMLPHWPSDARAENRRNPRHVQDVTAAARPVFFQDAEGKRWELQLETYPNSDLCPSNRLRRITPSFSCNLPASALVKTLEKRGDVLCTVPFTGDTWLRSLARAAHEESNAAHFELAFLVSAQLQEVHVAGLPEAAGPLGAQLYAQTPEYDERRGKVSKGKQGKGVWTACFADQVYCAHRGAKQSFSSCPIYLPPNVSEKPNTPLYAVHAGTNARLLRHLDCLAFGFDNFLVYREDKVPCIRAPIVDPEKHLILCQDSLVWFMLQLLQSKLKPDAFMKKISDCEELVMRRDEIDRYVTGRDFVPRAYLPHFEARRPREDQQQLTLDEEQWPVIAVVPDDIREVYSRAQHEALDRGRGVLDFSKGVRLQFRPLQPEACLAALRTSEQPVQLRVKLELVYVPLLGWLDDEGKMTATQKKADDEDVDEEVEEKKE